MRSAPRRHTFAHTFPTGNHAMWLCYWLAAASIDPVREVQLVTVPPGQMAANLEACGVEVRGRPPEQSAPVIAGLFCTANSIISLRPPS